MSEQLVMLALLIAATPIDIGRLVGPGQPFAVAPEKADQLVGMDAAQLASADEVKWYTDESERRGVGSLPNDMADFLRQQLAARDVDQAAQAAAEAEAKAAQEAAAAKAAADAQAAQEAQAAKAAADAQATQEAQAAKAAADAQAAAAKAEQDAAAKTQAKAGKKA